jgi:hypothetical protein
MPRAGEAAGAAVADKRRVAFGVCLVLSAAAHYGIAPLGLFHGFEMRDTEGEAAIPVDLLAPEAPPSPPEPAPTPPPPKAEEESGEQRAAKAAARLARGRDAGVADASPDASGPLDAGPTDGSADGSRTEIAGLEGSDGGGALDGAIAMGDAGAVGDPRDPQAIVGAAGAVQADVVLVMLVVNAEVIRENPVGAQLGYLLRGIPQWEDFMSGTDIDPVRDTDWVLISGPSLINTARDVVLIHYAASDAAVDRAVSIVSRKYDQGGPFDTGVPGVRATLAHADRAERVLLRPQSHVLAVVPPSVAKKIARQLVAARAPAHVRPGEAVYLRLVNPHHPMPEVPESITEMRLRVVPRADEGADVFMEGDTKDAGAAASAATDLRAMVRRHNDPITSLITHGLLDRVEVSTEGPKVLVHDIVTRDQIETIAALVGGLLGLSPPPALAPASSGAPRHRFGQGYNDRLDGPAR